MARSNPGGLRLGRGLAAVAAVVAVAVGSLTVANAATLSVSGGSVSTLEAGPCTDSSAPIDVQRYGIILYWAVTLSDIPQACQGKPIVVSANNNAVTGTSTGASSSTIQIGTNLYGGNPTFTVLIDGWVVPTS
jgi:hypothetical protein